MIEIKLKCPGPLGSNGCPDQRQFVDFADNHSSAELQSAWSRVIDKCGWQRDTKDRQLRCPSCSASGTDQLVAGISRPLWEKALELYCSGIMPSVWGGKEGLPTARQFNNARHKYPWMMERIKASPCYRPQGTRASELTEDQWDYATNLFLSGLNPGEVCNGDSGRPTAKQWNSRMSRNADFRSMVNGEHNRRRMEKNKLLDSVLGRYELGSLDLCELLPTNADRQRWALRQRTDDSFANRVAAARNKRHAERQSQLFDELFDRALTLLADGCEITKLPGQDGGTVTASAVKNRVGRDPIFAARYTEALAQRELLWKRQEADGLRKPPADRGRIHLSSLDLSKDWQGVIDDIRQGLSIWDSLDRRPNAPNRRQWSGRKRVDAAFALMIEDAKEVREFSTDWAKKRIARKKAWKEAYRKKHQKGPQEAVGVALKRVLNSNELFRAVNQAVSANLPPHVRDDVIQNMILAILEGELTLSEVRSKSRQYLRDYDRATERWKTVSVDQTIAGTEDLKLLDRLSTEDGLYFSWDEEPEDEW